MIKYFISFLILLYGNFLFAQPKEKIRLLSPVDNHVSVIQALNNRETCRKYLDKDLSLQELSNLLWCANGENRPATHKRTAPSAWNIKVIDVYVATKEGVYIYNPEAHELNLYMKGDIRKQTGGQDYVGVAAIDLIYVANYERNNKKSVVKKKFYATCDASHISQNVYIYCASAGLGTAVRDLVPREELFKLLNLNDNQAIVLAHTVGYPK